MSDIYSKRREKLREKIADQGLDALLVTHAANRFYLSGFELHDPQCNESAGCLLISTKGRDKLCTDPRYFQAAQRIWDQEDIFIYKGQKNSQLRDYLSGLNLSALGFESSYLCHELFATLSEKISLFPTKGLIENQRIIKDEFEIRKLEKSCALNHNVFEKIQDSLQPGISETDLAWEAEKLFRENGASELAFSVIAAAGPNAALPHAIPGTTQIPSNGPVLLDMGGRLNDYCSDQTRTFWVGDEPTAEFRKTLDLVQKAQDKAINSIRPGMAAKDLYAVARNFFEDHGVFEYFTHGLGHGIGLETHEPPSIGPHSEQVLQPGMVITVEPGLYYTHWGGVRWEYMLLVTEDGSKVL
jgi:Xaa-Pro aminopeptidase